MAKVSRKGVFYSIEERNGEWRVLLGNKIVSRHATEEAASAARTVAAAAPKRGEA
jgi:hypothetical protein